MEEKRLDRKVRTIEALFEKNPLNFDELQIDTMVQRQIKEKEKRHLFKTHEQIYEEVMEQNRKVAKYMKMLIEKYKIKIDQSNSAASNEHTHIKKCENNDQIYYNYRARYFFDGDHVCKQMSLDKANEIIKHITEVVEMKD